MNTQPTHTRLPWHIESHRDSKERIKYVKAADGQEICTSWAASLENDEEFLANVQLLAAAGELLEVCEEIVDDYEHLAFPEEDEVIAKQRHRMLNAVRAAIDKAKGVA